MLHRVLVNPAAGKGRSSRALEGLADLAEKSGAELHISESARDLTEQAERAVGDGVDRLLVAGGDGTFHHVAQALVRTDCALGVIPLGRGNDFAADLGVPDAMSEAFEFGLQGSIRSIDVGCIGERYFTGYCGMGFDSEAAHYAHEAPAFLRGTAAYVYSVLRTMFAFQPPRLTVRHDEGEFQGAAMFAVACNISRFGGGMKIAPQARFDDGVLDLVLAKKLGKVALLRVFPKVYSGEHVHHPAVILQRIRQVRIAADRSVAVACDGEPLGRLEGEELRVTVERGALRVVAP